MGTRLIKHGASTRCYKCGSDQISAVCHHCGRPLCNEHILRTKDPTREFAGLRLEEAGVTEAAAHCEHCLHPTNESDYRYIAFGVLFALAGLGLLAVAGSSEGVRAVGMVGLILGAVWTAIALLLKSRSDAQRKMNRIPFPLLPSFDQVEVRERLASRIELDDAGNYASKNVEGAGAASITVSPAPIERERYERYRKRFRCSPDEDRFLAGFVVLCGSAGMTLSSSEASSRHSSGVLPVSGSVRDLSMLTEASTQGNRNWHTRVEYALLSDAISSVSLRIVHALVPNSARRAFELQLQWSGTGKLEDAQIDLLELRVPATWGQFEQSTDEVLVAEPSNADGQASGFRTVTWRHIPITKDEANRRQRTFYIEFEGEIDLESKVSGRVELSYAGALSGISGIRLFLPTGMPVPEPQDTASVSINTTICADFDLSFARLRYQGVRVIPDVQSESDRGRDVAKVFAGVIPDHSTMIALTNELSRQGFYVKRVTENPPRTGRRADLVNRYWDVVGRKYDGVYPIDFHVVLTGEEAYSGELRAQGGVTRVNLSVQGAFANAEMEQGIDTTWQQLDYLVSEVMEKRPQVNVPQRKQRDSEVTAAAPDVELPPAHVARSDASDRVVMLQTRLDALTDALISGRISEQTYLLLKAQIEREISTLNAAN